MIKINRNRKDNNGDVIKPAETWFNRAKKETNIAIREKGQHNPKSNIYSDHHLRAILEELFHYKCAYCEYPLSEMGWDSEHYRPKSAVAERRDHHGYYWLIYKWGNLFPACNPCNRRRKDRPIYGDLTYSRTAGKGTQFPLKDESARALEHTHDISAESPLLLNPCSDNPESYLRYEIDGKAIPNNNYKRGIKRAKATINICFLNRRRLKRKRLEIIKSAVEILEKKNKLELKGNMNGAKSVEEILHLLLLDDRRSFAGTARAVIKDPEAFGV